jgi:hypothetical protein
MSRFSPSACLDSIPVLPAVQLIFGKRTEERVGLSAFRQDDLLAPIGSLEETRQVGLRFVNVDDDPFP